jgi:hypothetical protein
MANLEHVEVVRQGAKAIADWHRANPDTLFDLVGADFCGADLKGANLGSANLREANFNGANLSGADLTSANLAAAKLIGASLVDAKVMAANFFCAQLVNADLRGADLAAADFYGADLSDANLSDADASGVIFRQTTLIGTDFARTSLSAAAFANVDLSFAKNLDQVVFAGPSTIGIDTLYRSKNTIPKSFLLGCGIPEGLSEYLPALLGMQDAIQFYSCFISYSHKDEEFCKRLHSRMRDERLRVWYAPEDMPGGKKLHEEIETQIRIYDKLLLVLSEHSMASEWVKTEIAHARQREKKERKQILFPIRLVPFERIEAWKAFDPDTGKDMAREIREYFIPDFTNWKDHDAFETGFARLLKDLKAQVLA